MAAKPLTPAAKPDDVEVFADVEQGSDEWHQLRLGCCTASNFSTIMASGVDGGASKTRTKLLYQMAGEIFCGEPAENFVSAAMQRGRDMESEARDYYGRSRFADLARVGFVRRTLRDRLYGDWTVGCSPDSLVGQDGALEIKTMAPHLLIELAETGRFPTEHRHQCHGTLWVTGRQWIDLLVFYRGMPIAPTFRIQRDEAVIAEIARAVEVFQYDLRKLVERIKAKGA